MEIRVLQFKSLIFEPKWNTWYDMKKFEIAKRDCIRFPYGKYQIS